MRSASESSVYGIIVVVFALSGCVSPNIVIQPAVPATAAASADRSRGAVGFAVDGTEANSQANKYEERGANTQIGRSESLGVHLSDFWIAESPPVFIKRVLENNLKAWGFNVLADRQPVRLHGHVNKFSLESKAISALEFQADGVIDVDLDVYGADAAPRYVGHYVGTCTYKTATEIPNKENMERLFNSCVDDFQRKLDGDDKLRAALSSS